MEFPFTTLVHLIQESLFVIIIAGGFLLYAMYRGRQAVINVIFGLYLGLLFVQNAPFTLSFEAGSDSTDIYFAILLFVAVTVGATMVIAELMPEAYREKTFESYGKKLFLAAAATILTVLFSFHVIPVHEVFSISSPISTAFSNPEYFFWWLLAPFVLLYFHK